MRDMGQAGEAPPLRWPPLMQRGYSFAQEYEVVLLMDNRERFSMRHGGQALSHVGAGREVHAAVLRSRGITVEEKSLPIGDVVWVARSRSDPLKEFMLDHVLERKSVADLLNSIQSGQNQRFQRQKWWLARCGMRRILYLIEGDPDKEAPNPADNKTCKTASVVNELDGFRVLRSSGVNDTVAVLARITHALARAYATGVPPPASPADDTGGGPLQPDGPLPLYADWAAAMRRMRESRTVKDVWGLMLCAVPSLGEQTVEAILAHYPTLPSLWAAYQAVAGSLSGDGAAAARALLADLALPSGSSKVGLGKSAKVYDLLFSRGP
ncbi:restriction endonuclease type II-like protein [Haematococcus lacustris]